MKIASVKLKHTQVGGGDQEASPSLDCAKKNQVDKQNHVKLDPLCLGP